MSKKSDRQQREQKRRQDQAARKKIAADPDLSLVLGQDKFNREKRPCAQLLRTLLPGLPIDNEEVRMPEGLEMGIDVIFHHPVEKEHYDFQVMVHLAGRRPAEELVSDVQRGSLTFKTGGCLPDWEHHIGVLAKEADERKGDKVDPNIHLVIYDNSGTYIASGSTIPVPNACDNLGWASVSIVQTYDRRSAVLCASSRCPNWIRSRVGEVLQSDFPNPMAFSDDTDEYKNVIDSFDRIKKLKGQYDKEIAGGA